MTETTGRAMDDRPNVGGALALLQRRFLEQLPSRLRELEALLRQGRAEPGALGRWRDLSVAAQALNGAASTYGLGSIASGAALIEALCHRLAGGIAFATVASGLDAALDDVRAGIEAVAAPSMATATAAPTAVPVSVAAGPSSHVYILEGGELDAGALAAQLGAYGYTARAVGGRAGLIAAIEAQQPAAIIADMEPIDAAGTRPLPGGLAGSASLIVVSSRGDLTARIEAVRAGARAYVVAPFDIGELITALDRLTGSATPAPFRVLIVDDDAFSAAYHAAILESAGMITAVVSDPLDAMAQLINFDADLLLLDMYMPRFTGIELAAAIRQHPSFASLPIVYLSSERDVDKQLDAIAVGADDFLVKPVVPDRLISSVGARARRLRLLRGLVTQDPMTQLLNHAAFKERLKIELSRAARTKTNLIVGLLDIDHFKRVNDTYGHPAGDAVIKSLARQLKQRLRQDDVLARYGGEEFAVVLPDTDLAAAKQLMDELREGFAQLPQGSGDQTFSVTLSCGLAGFPRLTDPGLLIEAADQALYAAKQGGRNQVRLAARDPAQAAD